MKTNSSLGIFEGNYDIQEFQLVEMELSVRECQNQCIDKGICSSANLSSCHVQKIGHNSPQLIKQTTDIESLKKTTFPEFPIEFRVKAESHQFTTLNFKWFAPTTLSEIVYLKHQYKDAKLITGNTESAIEVIFKNLKYSVAIYTRNCLELREVSGVSLDNCHSQKDANDHVSSMNSDYELNGVRVGGCIDLTTLKHKLEEIVAAKKRTGTSGLEAILENLKWFAGKLVIDICHLLTV